MKLIPNKQPVLRVLGCSAQTSAGIFIEWSALPTSHLKSDTDEQEPTQRRVTRQEQEHQARNSRWNTEGLSRTGPGWDVSPICLDLSSQRGIRPVFRGRIHHLFFQLKQTVHHCLVSEVAFAPKPSNSRSHILSTSPSCFPAEPPPQPVPEVSTTGRQISVSDKKGGLIVRAVQRQTMQ